MKTTLDKNTRSELINRIETLTEASKAEWGSMNVCQMIKHCIAWEEMVAGGQIFRQAFIGRLFGKIALRSLTGNDKPVKRNMPTLPFLKITDNTCDIETEKRKWIALMEQGAPSPNPAFIHPFFGKLTAEETGLMAYKHADHHLRQFNS